MATHAIRMMAGQDGRVNEDDGRTGWQDDGRMAGRQAASGR
jgi:hypothetical protein